MIRQVDGDIWEVCFDCGLVIFYLKSTNYVNVTDYLQNILKYGNGYEIWKSMDAGSKLFTSLQRDVCTKNKELETRITHRKGFTGTDYAGIYIHPSLIPHIAYWVGPEHVAYIHHICLLIADQTQSLRLHCKEFEYKNSTLVSSMSKLKTDQYRNIQSIIDFVEKDVSQQGGTQHLLLCKLSKLASNINIGEDAMATNNYHRRHTSTHSFTLVRLNAKSIWNYFMLECKRKHLARHIEKIKKDFSKSTIILQQLYVPNKINVRNLIISDGTITINKDYCTLPIIGENKFLNLLIQFCQTDIKPNILAIYDETDCNVYNEIV